jgi:flagellar protein FliT
MTGTLSHYESVAAASGAMLEAARRQDWDGLAEAERRCAAVIAVLKASEAEARLDEADRPRKAEIIRRVLADDAEIRRLLDPRMQELERLLNAAGTRRRVDSAYGI